MRGDTRGDACKSEVIIERYRSSIMFYKDLNEMPATICVSYCTMTVHGNDFLAYDHHGLNLSQLSQSLCTH